MDFQLKKEAKTSDVSNDDRQDQVLFIKEL